MDSLPLGDTASLDTRNASIFQNEPKMSASITLPSKNLTHVQVAHAKLEVVASAYQSSQN